MSDEYITIKYNNQYDIFMLVKHFRTVCKQ